MTVTPIESMCVTQLNGWMNCDTFLTWLKHFVKYAHPTESPALPLLDGQAAMRHYK